MKQFNHTDRYPIALLAVVLTALFVIYFGTARSLVEIWNSSETFAHGYIILPVSLWLIWRKRQILKTTSLTPYWPGMLLIFLTGVVWLLADLGDVQVVRQYSFVALIPLIVLTLAGRQVFNAIAFPLCFLLLAVPFGDIFIGPLINFTADFTVMAVQATGVPILRNGTSFTLPSGNWSVVEACSGVRYLISSFTLGCLFAYLTYTDWKKRLLLIIASLILPVLANGLRAFMIVMIGHLSSMKLAVGFDHLIYGWIFFGLVMYLLFWVGNFWRDDKTEQPTLQTLPSHPTRVSVPAMLGSTAAVLLCLAIFPLVKQAINRANFNDRAANLDAFQSHWVPINSFLAWQPHYLPAQAELQRSYANDNSKVQLNIHYYRNQTHEAQLISSSNKMNLDDNGIWVNNTQSDRVEYRGRSDAALSIHETEISSASQPNQHLLIWSLDWVNGQFNNNHIAGKIIQTWNKIRLQGDDAAAIIISTPFSENPEEARTVLRSYLNADFDAIATVLDANRGR